MTDSSFTIHDLAATICKLLDLKESDTVELLRNRLDPNELKIVKHGLEEQASDLRLQASEIQS